MGHSPALQLRDLEPKGPEEEGLDPKMCPGLMKVQVDRLCRPCSLAFWHEITEKRVISKSNLPWGEVLNITLEWSHSGLVWRQLAGFWVILLKSRNAFRVEQELSQQNEVTGWNGLRGPPTLGLNQ